MSISLRELYNTLVGKSGYSAAHASYASLKQLSSMATNMYSIRTTTLPADAGADYNGYTYCNVHTVSSPTKDSVKEYDDTYVTHMASGYAARQTTLTCYCESRTATTCDCESRDSCACLGYTMSCTCDIDVVDCVCELNATCTCDTRGICTCETDGPCPCDSVTCYCDARSGDPVCTCDDRCRCNTVDLYNCPANT